MSRLRKSFFSAPYRGQLVHALTVRDGELHLTGPEFSRLLLSKVQHILFTKLAGAQAGGQGVDAGIVTNLDRGCST